MNKLEQTELAEAQERFKGIFESSKDAIGYATLEGKLVDDTATRSLQGRNAGAAIPGLHNR